MKILNLIKESGSIIKDITPGFGNYCSISTYLIGSELQLIYLHNGAGIARGVYQGQVFRVDSDDRELIFETLRAREAVLKKSVTDSLFSKEG